MCVYVLTCKLKSPCVYNLHAWSCVWEHCVQKIQCFEEKWPCVCLSECLFFSTICNASLFTLDSTCVLYTVYTNLSHCVCLCAHTCECVHVWLGEAPAVSEWAAPNAWTPRRGRKGGVRGRLSREWDEWGGGQRKRIGEMKGLVTAQTVGVKDPLNGVMCPSA